MTTPAHEYDINALDFYVERWAASVANSTDALRHGDALRSIAWSNIAQALRPGDAELDDLDAEDLDRVLAEQPRVEVAPPASWGRRPPIPHP